MFTMSKFLTSEYRIVFCAESTLSEEVSPQQRGIASSYVVGVGHKNILIADFPSTTGQSVQLRYVVGVDHKNILITDFPFNNGAERPATTYM